MKTMQNLLYKQVIRANKITGKFDQKLFSTAQTFFKKDLVVQKADQLKEKPQKDFAYTFGGISTDYMLDCNYDIDNGGWQSPIIKKNEPFMLDPSNATLQYSIECFEGMKAYITVDKKVTLFRPDMNFKRMNTSHKQLGLPSFDGAEMTECLKELVKIEKHWIPDRPMHSLYIRPTSICMDNKLGLSSVKKCKTFIVMCPVGPYYPRGFQPVKLYCDTQIVRAWPQGFGDKKIGGNYAPTMKIQRKGNELHGADQALWLLHDYVTEVGTMNFFVYWKNAQGEDELITPPLDGTILPGVTRNSILSLTRDMNRFKVSEKPFKIQELMLACKQGRVYEAFGAGTAAIVSPVKSFIYENDTYDIPIDAENGAGKLTQEILNTIIDIQYGKIKKPEWSVEVCNV